MDRDALLLPMLAQVFLTFLVFAWMYLTRLRAIRAGNVALQDLKDRADVSRLLASVAGPSNNLSNLFELPTLFYAVVIVLYVTNRVSPTYLALAWVFVGLRYVHSAIHCTVNHVASRFGAYFISALALWAMWALYARELLTS